MDDAMLHRLERDQYGTVLDIIADNWILRVIG
jgi:hypothetical protein